MADALVRTKLALPRPRPGLVDRTRLTEVLVRARDAALILVSAPAGFGKTTLLASALAGARQVAWVSLDARDSDAARFWAYVLHALEGASPGCATTALALLETGHGSSEDVVAALVNELSVRPEDLTLVLDDYHLADSPEVSDSVTLLLEHRPPQLHLVLGTRADPALPLSRLRARGDLVEVRAADLRFTTEEADSYLNMVHDLGLTTADVAALESRTEGWAAALQLAALSLRDRDDPPAFIASFAGDDRYVVDYLADEVLDQQPPQLRRFLLDTSVLERLSGPLCDAVTGPVDDMPGTAVLELLERRNLLLVPLDDHRRWYRYHHLFADVLQSRLRAERPDIVSALHGRASVWFDQVGDVEAAVRHAFAADDVDRAADLIEVAAPELRRRRAEGLLRSWVPMVPPEVVTRRPVLGSSFVGALMASNIFDGVSGRLDAIEASLAAPETLLVRDHAEWQRLPAQVATQRAGLALMDGDLAGTLAHAEEAMSRATAGDELTRASAAALKGLASWTTGDLDAAREAYLAATRGLARTGHVSDALGCTITVVELELSYGNLEAAQDAVNRALALIDATEDSQGTGAVARGTADMWVAKARVAWEHGDVETAAQHLERAGDLGEAAGLAQQPYRWRVALAHVRESQGDVAAALALLAEADRLFNSDFSPNVHPVPAVRARLHVRSGDLDAAYRWATTAGVTAADELTYLREYVHITLARLLLADHEATGDPAKLEAAAGLLTRLHDAATEAGRTAAAVETDVLLVAARDIAGRQDEALHQLGRVVDLLRPRHWLRPLIDAPPRVQDLLHRLPEETPLSASAAASVPAPTLAASEAHRHAPAAAPAAEPTAEPGAPFVASLSSRELDVLRLLGSDLDGPAIARHLNVSLPTVRTHTQHIYAKLGVNNRRAAVRRAHQLHL